MLAIPPWLTGACPETGVVEKYSTGWARKK